MKRWSIYGLVVIAALVLKPAAMKDVGDLIPVELLHVSKEGNRIIAETDTGAVGFGVSLDAALKDLKETAEGEVFLETADYLVITESAVGLLPELCDILRPAAEVCVGVRANAQAAGYLKAHPSPHTMKDVKAGGKEIPTLIKNGGQYRFGEPWKPQQKE